MKRCVSLEHCHRCQKCRRAVDKLNADIDRLTRILDDKVKASHAGHPANLKPIQP